MTKEDGGEKGKGGGRGGEGGEEKIVSLPGQVQRAKEQISEGGGKGVLMRSSLIFLRGEEKGKGKKKEKGAKSRAAAGTYAVAGGHERERKGLRAVC